MDWLVYIFYGFITGLGQLLPVSTGAHDFFLEQMTHFDTTQPLMRLFIHVSSLLAVFVFCRYRAFHVYRELRIASQPPRRRKRQPDLMAVLDGRVILIILIPAALGVLLTSVAASVCRSLPAVVVLLILSGLVIYVPHFLMTGNRDSRHASRAEASFLGLCAGLSAFPGISRMGMLLSIGAARGYSRSYLLDIAFLLMLPLLALLILLDLFALLAGGLAGLTLLCALKCLLSGVAAFGGASLAMASMRFLSVNMGYTAFAYYNWGLGIFDFLFYLMI